jgi:tetrahydromethanopterin S-methyltransferase subunit F
MIDAFITGLILGFVLALLLYKLMINYTRK